VNLLRLLLYPTAAGLPSCHPVKAEESYVHDSWKMFLLDSAGYVYCTLSHVRLNSVSKLTISTECVLHLPELPQFDHPDMKPNYISMNIEDQSRNIIKMLQRIMHISSQNFTHNTSSKSCGLWSRE